MSYFNHPNLPASGFSFDGEKQAEAQTERPTAKALREAWEDVVLAQKELDNATGRVPRYTAQWDNADYIRDEEQTLIIASNAFEDALVASVLARSRN